MGIFVSMPQTKQDHFKQHRFGQKLLQQQHFYSYSSQLKTQREHYSYSKILHLFIPQKNKFSTISEHTHTN